MCSGSHEERAGTNNHQQADVSAREDLGEVLDGIGNEVKGIRGPATNGVDHRVKALELLARDGEGVGLEEVRGLRAVVAPGDRGDVKAAAHGLLDHKTANSTVGCDDCDLLGCVLAHCDSSLVAGRPVAIPS